MNENRFMTDRLRRWRTIQHEESFERTLTNIEQFGWDAMLVRGETRSRFGYTTGAYDTLGLPELIVVGLTLEATHTALHLAIEQMRSGKDLTQGRHPYIVGDVDVIARPISRAWYEHVMFRTKWFYEDGQIPVLQIVYPDKANRFQWEDGFDNYFLQPILNDDIQGRAERDFWALNDAQSVLFNWKFSDPPYTRVFLSEAVHQKREAVTYVSHDTSDGAWQFLGDTMASSGSPVVSCFHHPVEDDRSLEELCDLPLGWFAVREKAGSPWQRFKKQPGDND
jgi:hypothetical protein